MVIADMGFPQAWRYPPVSWLLKFMVAAYRLSGSPQSKREADSFQYTYTLAEWRGHMEALGLRRVQVVQSQRRGQRMLPSVIFACGEKEGGSL
jgi:hypothetical protein